MLNILLAEALGTMILILLGNGVVANLLLDNTKGHGGGLIAAAAGWGFAVTIAVMVSAKLSGAHLNPVVTLVYILLDQTQLELAPYYFSGQFIGAALGSVLVYLAYLPHWAATSNLDYKLAVFCTMPQIRTNKANFMTEMISTAILIIGILGISDKYNGLNHGTTAIAVGLLVFTLNLCLNGPTGVAMNPARDLVPRLVHSLLPLKGGKRDSDWSYAWIPVVGPLCGGVCGALVFKLINNLSGSP